MLTATDPNGEVVRALFHLTGVLQTGTDAFDDAVARGRVGSGDLVLVEASPEGYRELTKFHAFDGKTWNHPVVAHGKLFVRNSEEMAAFRLPSGP